MPLCGAMRCQSLLFLECVLRLVDPFVEFNPQVYGLEVLDNE